MSRVISSILKLTRRQNGTAYYRRENALDRLLRPAAETPAFRPRYLAHRAF
ncbi:MAG: hypothetical protein AAFY66_14330 [Pseudomonadota bacterium]